MPGYQAQSTIIADGAYNAFPNLAAQYADGTGLLYVVYRKGATHTSVDGKIVLKTSSDRGATWSSETILATPIGGHDYRDPGIVRTATGRLLVTFFDYDGANSRGLITMYSDSAGAAWSALSSLIIPYTGADKGASTSPVLQHSSGTLLWPIYGENSGDPGIGCGLIRSTDNGNTWGSLIPVTTNTNDWSEWVLIELPNTSVRGYLRQDEINQASPVAIWQNLSSNVGLTWSAPSSLGFDTRPGKPMPVVSRLTRYLYLWYRAWSPTVNAAVWRYSADLGTTWSGQQTYNNNVYEYAGGSALNADVVGFAVAYDNGVNRSDLFYASITT